MMSKNKLKKIAKIYAASAVHGLLETGATASRLTIEDEEYFTSQLHKIADRISDTRGSELEAIVELVHKSKYI